MCELYLKLRHPIQLNEGANLCKSSVSEPFCLEISGNEPSSVRPTASRVVLMQKYTVNMIFSKRFLSGMLKYQVMMSKYTFRNKGTVIINFMK